MSNIKKLLDDLEQDDIESTPLQAPTKVIPDVKKVKPRNSDNNNDPINNNHLDSFGKIVYSCPFLMLFEKYALSQNFARRSKEKCVYQYAEQHKDLYDYCCTADFILRIIFIGLLIYVTARGIGIIKG